jgi:IclR family acetate operon transcriptional repressor
MSKTSDESDLAFGAPKALVKGIALIDLVVANAHVGPVRQSDLVDASGLPRATALRILDALVKLGLLRHVDDQGYVLGAHLGRWGGVFLQTLDVARLADDLIRDVTAVTRETCYLGVRDGDGVLYVAASPSPQAIRPVATVGGRNSLHCTGIGKALLAFEEPDEREATIQRIELSPRMPNTIVDRDRLRDELDVIAARGYSIDDIENEADVRCVAAPVRDHAGRVVAAMSLSVPTYRFTYDEIIAASDLVRSKADALSARLGFHAASSSLAS